MMSMKATQGDIFNDSHWDMFNISDIGLEAGELEDIQSWASY